MSSRETDAIIAYQATAGVPVRVTSIDDAAHAPASRHYQFGTPPGAQGVSGRGLAVDFAGPHQYARHPRLSAPELVDIATAFLPVQNRLHELICSHLGYSIKNGRKVPMMAVAEHWNHVHVSVDKNVFLAPLPPSHPNPNPAAPEVRPMYDPPLGPLAAVWQDNQQRVIAAVSPDGEVYAWGCKWVGNVKGKAYWLDRTAAAIGPRDDGQEGYMVTATTKETYRLPDGLDVL